MLAIALRVLAGAVIGGVLGGVVGYLGQCRGST